MIRARRITEHGAEDRVGVQVDITGALGDIELELDKLLKSLDDVIDATVEDVEEKYEIFGELMEIMERGATFIKRRITLRKAGLKEEEIHQIKELAKSGKEPEDIAARLAEIIRGARDRVEQEAENRAAEETADLKAEQDERNMELAIMGREGAEDGGNPGETDTGSQDATAEGQEEEENG